MVHRSASAACAALTVLGALVLTGLPAAAAVEPPAPTPAPSAAETLGANSPSPVVLRAMERDLAHPALAPVARWFDANVPQHLRDSGGGEVR